MDKKKEVLLYFIGTIIFLIAIAVSGCGLPSTQMEQLYATQAMMTVIDGEGARVSVPVHAKRIVLIGASTADIVVPMVGVQRIIAMTKVEGANPEEHKIKGRVTATTESILACHPDLVIIPDWEPKGLIDKLRAIGLPVYVYKTPDTVEQVERLIKVLGGVLDAQDKADTMVDEMKNRLQRIWSRSDRVPKSKRKTAMYVTTSGVTGGRYSMFDSFCYWAGLRNGAAVLGLSENGMATEEIIVKGNPDIIFVPSDVYNTGQWKVPTVDSLLKNPALQDVTAIKHKAVYVVNAKWMMGYSQYIVNAIETMERDAYGQTN